MGNDDVREIAKLKIQLRIASLASKKLWFTYEVPDEYCLNRTRSGYDQGYEAGWRGWEYMNPFARPHWQVAYRRGYSDAKYAINKEALKLAE